MQYMLVAMSSKAEQWAAPILRERVGVISLLLRCQDSEQSPSLSSHMAQLTMNCD